MLLCLFTLSGLKCGNDSTGSLCRGRGANVEKSSCCMLIWSGKNYGHGQGKSWNLILHKEWDPCCCSYDCFTIIIIMTITVIMIIIIVIRLLVVLVLVSAMHCYGLLLLVYRICSRECRLIRLKRSC